MIIKKTLGILLLGFSLSVAAAGLETQKQKYSYTLGSKIAKQLQQQGMDDVDIKVFIEGLEDVFLNKTLKLTDEQMAEVKAAQREVEARQEEAKSYTNQSAGKLFLAQNQLKDGVITLASGLQYVELRAGEGDSPAMTDKVRVHYHGTLPNGQVFDSSVDRGKPADFRLNGVIKGFSEALSLMKPGAKWRVFIPSELGYGERSAGADIGPYQALIFDLELLKVL